MLNPLALPLHAPVVHLPVAMLTVTWLCVIGRHVSGSPRWDERTRLFEFVGVLALPATLVTAIVDTRGFGFITNPRFDAPLIWHMAAGLAAAAFFGGHFLWRRRRTSVDLGRLALATVDVGLATLGMLALTAAGLLAAEMVYAT
jgi:uncharacterized membrane protein